MQPQEAARRGEVSHCAKPRVHAPAQGGQALAARHKQVKALLSNRRLPEQGWDDATIQMFVQVRLPHEPAHRSTPLCAWQWIHGTSLRARAHPPTAVT